MPPRAGRFQGVLFFLRKIDWTSSRADRDLPGRGLAQLSARNDRCLPRVRAGQAGAGGIISPEALVEMAIPFVSGLAPRSSAALPFMSLIPLAPFRRVGRNDEGRST